MNLHKQTVDARCNARTRKLRDVLGLSTRALSLTAWQLQTVRHVEHNRTTETLHDRKTAEVDYEVVVAKRRPSLGQQQALVAGLTHFLHDVLHFPWSQELTFFYIDDFTGVRRCNKQVCLARKECRYLKNIQNLARRPALRGLMYVGKDWQP